MITLNVHLLEDNQTKCLTTHSHFTQILCDLHIPTAKVLKPRRIRIKTRVEEPDLSLDKLQDELD